MFEVNVNGLAQQYRTKPTMNVDITGSSTSIPKPLTYDYMPEGYPSKDIEYVTLMEEQEVAFTEKNGLMGAISPVALDTKLGDKLTVVWDGVSYDVTVKALNIGPSGVLAFGNLGLTGIGDEEDYPFAYMMAGSKAQWATTDTATSHTIKVMRPAVKYAPIDANFMPEGYPKKNVKIDTSEEQEVAFTDNHGTMTAQVSIDFEITYGDNLTVVWDGVSYDVVVKNATAGPNTAPGFGNLGLLGYGDTTEHPFLCVYRDRFYMWGTADTATSHTIKVMRQQVTITPMSTDFIPPMKNLNVVFKKESGSTTINCNVTYNELRDWVERDVPVFAVFINAADYSQCNIFNITGIGLLTDMLGFVYYINNGTSKYFAYKSDGTIEPRST